jgi:ATP-dependent metalloprotease
MVTEMGFSDLLGDVDLVTNYSGLSSETKQKIEREVQRIVDEARQRAKAILTEKRKELDLVAKALVEYEILSSEEMAKILKGEKLAKMTASPNTPIKLPELPFPPSIGRPVSPSIPGVGPLPGSDAGSGVGPLSGGKPPTTGGDGGVDA